MEAGGQTEQNSSENEAMLFGKYPMGLDGEVHQEQLFKITVKKFCVVQSCQGSDLRARGGGEGAKGDNP